MFDFWVVSSVNPSGYLLFLFLLILGGKGFDLCNHHTVLLIVCDVCKKKITSFCLSIQLRVLDVKICGCDC